ncbi:MAG: hypothetical protein KDE35_16120 [Geminicoccaceae bacterium]|nr:hypothetical protein [Geminicoccaceae bacterium]
MRTAITVLTLWAAGLAGCSVEGPSLAGQPGLQVQVERYYREHATEENGICTRPWMRGITRSRVVEDDAERLVLEVRYYYVDDGYPDDGVPRVPRTCTGFAQRLFTMARTPGGLEVIGMSGPTRVDKDFGMGS